MDLERKIYLENTDIEDALERLLEQVNPEAAGLGTEETDIRRAVGRITAAPVFARLSSPNHNAAAMDGIMVVAARTYDADETHPIVLTRGRDFEYINTGHMITEPYDSVIMIEDVSEEDADHLRILAPAAPWQHIRPVGEDIVAGEMILPENHRIRPIDVGAVLNSGITRVIIWERVRVGIMPTGNEITDDYSSLEKGKTFDSNSWSFKAMVEEWGGAAERIPPVPDDYEALKAAAGELLQRNHMLIINAGSSAGSRDYTVHVVQELGQLLLHGVAIRPGKPTILGAKGGKPIIGVPGYPGSAFLAFEEFAGPALRKLQRAEEPRQPLTTAVLSRRVVSSLKYKEYIRVNLGKVGDRLIATPLNRGAGVSMSLVKADGLMNIPKSSEGFEGGQEVQVQLTRDSRAIEDTIVSIGSHDLIMDFIGSLLEKDAGQTGRRFHLSSAHVGSMGGIMALKRGEAHLAPIHLLDEASGQYNASYLERYLKDEKVVLVKGVQRQQGFMVAAGNPKQISGIGDLLREDISFVNRQKGSGTRILTDYLLKQAGLDSGKIRGYQREMTTHMAVAAAVEGGTADTGVGVYSAAKSMGLDFIPIGFEEYDFAVPEKYLETPMLQAFLQVLESEAFRRILEDLGGYSR